MTDALAAMLRARSVAVVGASARPGSFGERMLTEVSRSTGRRIHPVNPRYDEIGGVRCVASLSQVDEPVDLALLGVADDALETTLREAAAAGVRSAVVFGSAHPPALRAALRTIAVDAGMALCGGGCMGFVNVADGLRAIGYLERAELPRGPIAVVTHSGSVFSALLRTHRALGFDLAVSSGQELVTTTADYLEHILDETSARVIGLVLETVRDGSRLVAALRRAAERDVPVVLLPLGGSPAGSALVTAHSGALAGAHGMWEAMVEGTGALPVSDLAEFTDTLELLVIGRRPRRGVGIATVHDSGAERTLVADLAHELAVPFAPLAPATTTALNALLDDGLVAANPLDLWGNGADTRELFGTALRTLAGDPAVSVVALAVDLVEEYDGDTSYPDAVLDVAGDPSVPLAVLTNLPSAIDQDAAGRLRAAGVPVLEGTRSGLVALRNALALRAWSTPEADEPDEERRARWRVRLSDPTPWSAQESAQLIGDYGLDVVGTASVADADAALAGARALGYPVVLKTDEPGVAHKSDVGGVVLAIGDDDGVQRAYRDLAERLGPRVSVSATAPAGIEVALGLVHDPQLGPLVVVGAGGVLTEVLADRAMALPPLTASRARALVDRLRLRAVLAGVRGAATADVDALIAAIVGLGRLAAELGDHLEALDVNPLLVGPAGVVAVDALVIPRVPGQKIE